MNERTAMNSYALRSTVARTIAVLMHGDGVLDAPEIAKRVLPDVAQRPSQGNHQWQEQGNITPFSERVVVRPQS